MTEESQRDIMREKTGDRAGADVLLFHQSLVVQQEMKDNKTEQMHRR